MASFQIQNLKTTEVLDGSSYIPTTITQDQTFYASGAAVFQPTTVTRKLTISQLRTWFDSGIYKEIRSGPSILVSPENFTNSGTINFDSPGLVTSYAGPTTPLPTGWLLCDGALVSTATYSVLFGLIGYTYGGSGDSFGVPNLNGRSVFGPDTMSGVSANRVSNSSLYGTAGVENHSLTIGQTPFIGHNHPTYSGNYPHYYGTSYQGDHNESRPENITGSPTGNICFGQTVTIELASVASGSSHNNLPPYLNLNWIIKT